MDGLAVTGVRDSGLGQPVISKQEVRDSKISSIGGINHVVTRPRDSIGSARSSSSVVKLGIVQSRQSKITVPLAPPSRIDDAVHKALHVNRPRVVFPRPSQICCCCVHVRRQIISCSNRAVLYRSPRVLVWICSPLCGYGVELPTHWEPRVHVARLEHCRRVSEYEIHRAVYVAFSVELSQGMRVQRVLVPLETAAVKRRQICAVANRHRLVLLRPGGVADSHVHSHESRPNHRCNMHIMISLLHLYKS
ncbi:hypothetical protein CR513_43416, partial [Mucuna pruriens]